MNKEPEYITRRMLNIKEIAEQNLCGKLDKMIFDKVNRIVDNAIITESKFTSDGAFIIKFVLMSPMLNFNKFLYRNPTKDESNIIMERFNDFFNENVYGIKCIGEDANGYLTFVYHLNLPL